MSYRWPHRDLDATDGLARSAARARRLGFEGKQVTFVDYPRTPIA